MFWFVVVLVVVVVLLRIRARRKRALVAGLDKPAFWTTPAPGRIRDRKADLL